ncbi:MAG TPA: YqkE family protein [Bacillus bacterium]|nr:YqkE family protein [Bacillus sp. (in: firmicutes)]
MAKKKLQNKNSGKIQQQDDKISVLDRLDQNVFAKLKEKQQELKIEAKKQQELEEERKRLERKQREKNKSFEELLSESDLDWKKFK